MGHPPHGKDQLDNALRLKRRGLGLVAQQDGLAPDNLRRLFTAAINDAWMRNNRARLRTLFETQDNAPAANKRSVLEIERVLAEPV